MATATLLAACSSPAIDGVLDCKSDDERSTFAVVGDAPEGPLESPPLDVAPTLFSGLEPEDSFRYAPEDVPEASDNPIPGDLVIIRDDREVAWFRFVKVREGVWFSVASSVCPEVDIGRERKG